MMKTRSDTSNVHKNAISVRALVKICIIMVTGTDVCLTLLHPFPVNNDQVILLCICRMLWSNCCTYHAMQLLLLVCRSNLIFYLFCIVIDSWNQK